jgi:hypothetical protein
MKSAPPGPPGSGVPFASRAAAGRPCQLDRLSVACDLIPYPF